ncbi:large conductance mechanosensitive channel protein MscL [Aminicella lysinilytica]|jgi:large conductance mechanosensitive channel|uniref:large conductance mechanosensitive channel protein MscL n=1 Tax=Aminicella lysinilytica TaxID=433323 RepID=UPI0017E4DB7D|nr:large conductance mechanosensitive channel protein MscL [Aminicella lysinilytica]NLD11559.1 large conductance mechanosensitive channel protein MscL [Clostridiales bacterium]
MKKFMEEFKEFALKGNVMDMAVGIIIGAAFTAIVTSLVSDIISPLLGLIVKVNFADLKATVGGTTFMYGNFIMAVINFLLIALVLFLIIRSINRLSDIRKKDEEVATPTTKICPYCKSEIPVDAVRCPHCTSELE